MITHLEYVLFCINLWNISNLLNDVFQVRLLFVIENNWLNIKLKLKEKFQVYNYKYFNHFLHFFFLAKNFGLNKFSGFYLIANSLSALY